MDRAIQETIAYTSQRQAFGKSILDNQYVHYRLAELQTEVECLRALLYQFIYIIGLYYSRFPKPCSIYSGLYYIRYPIIQVLTIQEIMFLEKESEIFCQLDSPSWNWLVVFGFSFVKRYQLNPKISNVTKFSGIIPFYHCTYSRSSDLINPHLHVQCVQQHVAGEDITPQATMLKLKSGRLVREVTDSCLQFWGGQFFLSLENNLHRIYIS